MAAFLIAVNHGSPGPLVSDSTWKKVRGLVSERSPHTVESHEAGNVRVVYAGPFGGASISDSHIHVSDGRPEQVGNPVGGGGGMASSPADQLSGEFSFCKYDRASGDIALVRDRFGTRPLYYVVLKSGVIAASECKALVPFLPEVAFSDQALSEALRFRWVVGKDHVISPIRQVVSGSEVKIDRWGRESVNRYWKIPFRPEYDAGSIEIWAARLHEALRRFFHDRQLSRVRLGILLSGGVDSSVVAAVAREECPGVVAYVGSLPAFDNEETRRAELVAKRLGIPCRVVQIMEGTFERDLRRMVRRLEEPPRNPNNLVLMQIYERMAADGIEVVLTGDAAEMLLGLADTRRVAMFEAKRRWVRRMMPRSLQRIGAGGLQRTNSQWAWRLARVLRQETLEYALTLDEISHCPAVQRVILASQRGSDFRQQYAMSELVDLYEDFEEGLQAYQSYTFLQSSLVRHDRMSQPLGLESITPFLSKAVVELACELPRELRYTNRSRPVLKYLCDEVCGPDVTQWEKLGFPVPWRRWLNGPLSAAKDAARLWAGGRSALPAGFLEAAFVNDDSEGIWTAMTLSILASELSVGME